MSKFVNHNQKFDKNNFPKISLKIPCKFPRKFPRLVISDG